MDVKKYMVIDLVMLTIIGLIAVLLKYTADTNHITLFMLDFIVLVVFIAMFRWRFFGSVVIIPLMIILGIVSGNRGGVTLIYFAGSITFLLTNLWFVFLTPKDIASSIYYLSFFVLTGFLSMYLGRSLVAMIVNGDGFLDSFGTYIAYDSLSIVMTVFLLFMLRKNSELFVDYYQVLTEKK